MSHPVRRSARLGAILALGLLALLALGAAQASALSFGAPRKLPKSPPGGILQGGEPSAAFDADGRHLYVTAPQSIPSVAGGEQGVGFWASNDGGRTFPIAKNIGSLVGGGDSDVAVGRDHTVYTADLEAIASDICRSHDHGATFGDNCQTGIASNQQGPEADREWLSADPNRARVLYLTYHDFAAEVPLIERSTDGGASFAPCGSVFDPNGPAFRSFTPTGGTDVGKPAVDRQGDVFIPITEPDGLLPTNPYDGFYVAVGRGGCHGQVFRNYTIYHHTGAALANIFSDLVSDRAGNLYAAAAGTLNATQKTFGVYLFVSRDKGKTWSKPIRVNPARLRANVLPAIAPGRRPGQLAIGWYGTATSGSPNNTADRWRYYAATTFDSGRHFQRATVTPQVFHYGDICTAGILCGTPGEPDNRNLADFTSVAVNPRSGRVAAVIPGDPYDTPGKENTTLASAYVALQRGGRLLTTAPRHRRRHHRRRHHRRRHRAGPRFTG